MGSMIFNLPLFKKHFKSQIIFKVVAFQGLTLRAWWLTKRLKTHILNTDSNYSELLINCHRERMK